MNLVLTIITVLILLFLFTISLKLRIFDFKGSVAALIMGAWVAFLASVYWLILMVLFAVSSYLATRAFFDTKKKLNIQEGKSGERRTSNIMFAGGIGAAIALLFFINNLVDPISFPFFELFAVSFAVINADTFASELGTVDRNVYLITTFERVERGVNGGISATGTLASALGSLIVGIIFSFLEFGSFYVLPVLFITAMGFLGSIVDSFAGAIYENRGKISKGMVNFIATFAAVAVSVVLLEIIPLLS